METAENGRVHAAGREGLAAAGPVCGYDGRVRQAGRPWRAAVGRVAAAAAVVALPHAGQRRSEPIRFVDRAIVVENQTADEWQNIEVWLNDHYRSRSHGCLQASGSAFRCRHSWRGSDSATTPRADDTRRRGDATAPGGRAVKLVWGTGRRRKITRFPNSGFLRCEECHRGEAEVRDRTHLSLLRRDPVVDKNLGRIVSHQEPVRGDRPDLDTRAAGRPGSPAAGGDLPAVRRIREDARRCAVAALREALRQARQEPITKPKRDFDLD